MKWMLNCHEASELVSQSLDRQLPWPRRMALRMHLLMCKHCSKFADQLQLMRHLLKRRREEDEKLPQLSQKKKEELKKILNPHEPPPRP